MHTKGPWRFNPDDFHIVSAEGAAIARVRPMLLNCSDDARLISAAPELLEACKDLAFECQLRNEGGSGQFITPPSQTTLRKLNAAIRKAEGKQP